MTVAWDPPDNNTDGTLLTDLAGYKVYCGATSGNYSSTTDVGNVTSCQFSNLQAGSTCFFATSAYTSSGVESDLSLELAYSVPVERVPATSLSVSSCAPGIFAFGMVATNGYMYTLQSTTSLVSGAWADIVPYTNLVGSGEFTLVVTNGMDFAGSMFFRVAIVREP